MYDRATSKKKKRNDKRIVLLMYFIKTVFVVLFRATWNEEFKFYSIDSMLTSARFIKII